VLFLKTCRALEGIEASRRIATVVIVAFVALLVAAGCRAQKPQVVVSAGDISVCRTEGDEATAKLVEGSDGATVLTLGDNAYPEGSVASSPSVRQTAMSPAVTTTGGFSTGGFSGRQPAALRSTMKATMTTVAILLLASMPSSARQVFRKSTLCHF